MHNNKAYTFRGHIRFLLGVFSAVFLLLALGARADGERPATKAELSKLSTEIANRANPFRIDDLLHNKRPGRVIFHQVVNMQGYKPTQFPNGMQYTWLLDKRVTSNGTTTVIANIKEFPKQLQTKDKTLLGVSFYVIDGEVSDVALKPDTSLSQMTSDYYIPMGSLVLALGQVDLKSPFKFQNVTLRDYENGTVFQEQKDGTWTVNAIKMDASKAAVAARQRQEGARQRQATPHNSISVNLRSGGAEATGPAASTVRSYLRAIARSDAAGSASFVSTNGISGKLLEAQFGRRLSSGWELTEILSEERLSAAEKNASVVAELSFSSGSGGLAEISKLGLTAFDLAIGKTASGKSTGGETIMTARTFYLVLEGGAWRINKVGPCGDMNGRLVAPTKTR